MLSKRLCRACFDRRPILVLERAAFEQDWEEKRWVFCPKHLDYFAINGRVPKKCPYGLEHVMDNQKC